MKAYLELLEHILENGEKKEDRTGTGTHYLHLDINYHLI